MLTIPRRGLVLDLPLNWDAKDYSWNWHDGTPTDVAWVETNIGYQSKCASFNGSSSYVDCWKWDGSNIYTISFRMFTSKDITSTTSWQWIINTSTSDDGFSWWIWIWNISWYADNETLCIWDWKHNDYWRTYIKDIIPAWRHFIIFVFNWETYDIYVDLLKKQTYIWWDPNGTACRALKFNSIYIWKDEDNNYFNWLIQNIRIYNRVLTEPEIRTLYLEWLRKLTPARNVYL